jgi:uncharacterized RmlC-like cupin family protein
MSAEGGSQTPGQGETEQPTIRGVPPNARVVEEPATRGMVRERAFASEGYWVGVVKTAPGMVSGWHHHGDYDTFVYLVSGRARVEFGSGGTEVREGMGGGFAHIPKGVIHRESNPSDEESVAVVVRLGTGVPVVNVNRPEG